MANSFLLMNAKEDRSSGLQMQVGQARFASSNSPRRYGFAPSSVYVVFVVETLTQSFSFPVPASLYHLENGQFHRAQYHLLELIKIEGHMSTVHPHPLL